MLVLRLYSLYARSMYENIYIYIYIRRDFLSWMIWCADPWLISRYVAISFAVMQRFSFMMASAAAMAFGVTTWCAWPGRGESVTELMPFVNFLVHSYTCCSDRHASPYWTFICWWISMGFTPSLLKKQMTECCSSLVHVASVATVFTLLLRRRVAFLHLLATLQTMSIIVVNFQDNRVVFWIFIALLRFSFDSPSYLWVNWFC